MGNGFARKTTAPVILVFDDDATDCALIENILSHGEHRLIVANNLDEFRLQMAQHPIDLAIISLAGLPEHNFASLQAILQDRPGTKVLALAPAPQGDGLSTLLQAESLHAHHLLAKPINPRHLASILTSTLPQPSPQQ